MHLTTYCHCHKEVKNEKTNNLYVIFAVCKIQASILIHWLHSVKNQQLASVPLIWPTHIYISKWQIYIFWTLSWNIQIINCDLSTTWNMENCAFLQDYVKPLVCAMLSKKISSLHSTCTAIGESSSANTLHSWPLTSELSAFSLCTQEIYYLLYRHLNN